MTAASHHPPCQAQALAGLGLKPAQLDAALAAPAGALDFVEVHAENAMVPGGPLRRAHLAMAARWPVSVHGVGLSLGGRHPPDEAHLDRLAAVVQLLQPRWVSEHLAWSSHGGVFYADLLPIAYNAATLRRLCRHVDRLQQRLGRQVLIENPSSYFAFDASTFDEAQFLTELVRRTGCGLLVDVCNAAISAFNNGGDAQALLGALPAEAIGEVHLAGFTPEADEAGAPLWVDTHGAAVPETVWALYRGLIARIGPRPTLVERDRALPPLPELLHEVAQARAVMRTAAPRTQASARRPRPQVPA